MRRRPVARLVAAFLVTGVLLSGGLIALAVSHPIEGPAYAIRSALEERLSSREVRYEIHQALGKLFSICPCTEGLAREQFRRAWFHRPLSARLFVVS